MKEQEEQNRTLELLNKLNHHEEFTLWRDEIAKPFIEKLEKEIMDNADKMSEVILRANLKSLHAVKDLFYGVLDQVAYQVQNLRDEEKEVN